MEKEILFFEVHKCPDWDDMVIGPEDPEGECCVCKYFPRPQDFDEVDGDDKGQDCG